MKDKANITLSLQEFFGQVRPYVKAIYDPYSTIIWLKN